jgi:hypothetical protein
MAKNTSKRREGSSKKQRVGKHSNARQPKKSTRSNKGGKTMAATSARTSTGAEIPLTTSTGNGNGHNKANRRKGSGKKRDPLARYRKQSDIIIKMLFDDDDTPDFIQDLLTDWLTELENQTQVFYNHREIAVVALPLMLKAADEMELKPMSQGSPVFLDAIASLHGRREVDRSERLEEILNTPERQLRRELEKDAEAIARIINSPHVPDSIKNAVSEFTLEITDSVNEHPAVIRVQYPLAILSQTTGEEKDGEQ